MVYLLRIFALGVAVKAIVIGWLVTAFIGGFADQVIITLVSAITTGLFAVFVAWMTERYARKRDGRIDEIAQRQKDIGGAVGVGKRRDDPAVAHGKEEETTA